MSTIEVQRLKLSCRSEARERMRFAIEDGLRTSIPDESRLVLIQRMQVKGDLERSHPAFRDQAFREGWLGAITGARHGSEDGASSANCVWFASREEAETLLLARLLAGVSVDAWYWKLALPHWRGGSLRSWLPECLTAALDEGSPERLARIAQCCIVGGATELLLDALGHAGKGPDALAFAAADAAPTGEKAGNAKESAAPIDAPVAERLASAIPSRLRYAICKLSTDGREARLAASAMVEALLLKTSPAIAVSPLLRGAIVSQTIEILLSTNAAQPRYSRVGRPNAVLKNEPDAPKALVGTEPTPLQQGPASILSSLPERPTEVDTDIADVADARPADSSPKPIAAPQWQRLTSAHAGLWLIVPSLIQLGFREWILKRPDLLAENPGRQLFEELATHYRIRAGDPALAPLEGSFHSKRANDWVSLWRSGLDGWLRRVARRRLHELLGRQGILELGDRELRLHFPAADLRLRLRALDRDPGWTDWLGFSVRYHFSGIEDRL